MNMIFKRKLPIPKEIKEMFPISEHAKQVKEKRDIELKEILSGKKEKLILLIGPCSADNEEAVLEYLSRLKEVNEMVKDKIFIIPRIYTNKPRSSSEDYKGMLHQPNPNGKEDMLNGLLAIRRLHAKALSDYDFTCADEMLYPEDHRYLSDILGYVAVGARSIEDQQHRLTASGLNIPVGMKNPINGDLNVLMNAIKAGQNPHTFIYRGWEVESKGNEYCHAIVRGYINSDGEMVNNYHYDDLLKVSKLYQQLDLKNPAVIVDCNHANSKKNYLHQIDIAFDVMQSMKKDKNIKKLVKGLMVESYLEDGQQRIEEGVFGKSITDGCLGWDKTRQFILDLYKLF